MDCLRLVLVAVTLTACVGDSSVPIDAGGDATEDASPDATGQDATAETGADAGPTVSPLSFGAGHLQLWLTADQGVTCDTSLTPNRVTRWADRSPHGTSHDATPQHGQLPPECHVASHAAAGVDLPYFSSPAATNTPDETLDLDLSYLSKTSYTVLVVERRWADRSGAGSPAEYVLGTTINDNANCLGQYNNAAFGFGYNYFADKPAIELSLEQYCQKTPTATVAAVPNPAPAALSYEIALLDTTVGHTFRLNGAVSGTDANKTALQTLTANTGTLGRAYKSVSVIDSRFIGDIAEVVVYDAALSQTELLGLEAYAKAHWQL